MEKQDTHFCDVVPVEKLVAIAWRRFGTGECCRSVGEQFSAGLSTSQTVSTKFMLAHQSPPQRLSVQCLACCILFTYSPPDLWESLCRGARECLLIENARTTNWISRQHVTIYFTCYN